MFVDPGVRDALQAARGKHLAFGRPIDTMRREVNTRARAQPAGPEVSRVRDTTIPGRSRHIPVRVYEPDDLVGAVIAFHGGGWVSGDLELFDATARHLASASGQAVVSVDYRLAPEAPFPAAFEDACDALLYLDGANEIWASPRPIALFGESAGGNLAAAAALAAPDLGVQHLAQQVLVYPVLDAAAHGGSVDRFGADHLLTSKDLALFTAAYAGTSDVDLSDWRLSPLHATVDARTAPALLISAALDPVKDQAGAYAAKLATAGVLVSHVTCEGVPHLFYGMRGLTSAAQIAHDVAAGVLRRVLTTAAASHLAAGRANAATLDGARA